jgi:hypothetical protein
MAIHKQLDKLEIEQGSIKTSLTSTNDAYPGESVSFAYSVGDTTPIDEAIERVNTLLEKYWELYGYLS